LFSEARRNYLGVRNVPKVASNCSTTNDCFGAIAALHFQSKNYRFTPFAAIKN
jgi:hypothetical protein